MKELKSQPNGWNEYQWTEGRFLWENPAAGYEAVIEPTGVQVYRYSATAYAYIFRNGRVITSDPTTGTRHWNPIVGETAPDFALPTLDGTRTIRLSDLKGSVVLLDFWASWCGPCQNALPGTETLYEKYKEKGLNVIGINIEGDPSSARAEAQKLGLTFPIVAAQSGPHGANGDAVQVGQYGVNAIPHGVLIDKKGVIRAEDVVVDDETLIDKLLSD